MASAASALSTPSHPGVQVKQQSVSATGVEASATNGFLFVKFPDDRQLNAFVSGLDRQGIAHTISGLSVRFTVYNSH